MTVDALINLVDTDPNKHAFCFCPSAGDILALPAGFLYFTVGESTQFLRWGTLGSTHKEIKSALLNVHALLDAFPKLKNTQYELTCI